jgi:hypothetical protein
MRAVQRANQAQQEASAAPAAPSTTPNPATAAPAPTDTVVFETLVGGLAQLIEAQRRLADELGIGYSHAFRYDFSRFAGQDLATALRAWMRTEAPEKVAADLKLMFEDIALMQAAMMAGMDIVARRAIRYLAPELTRGGEGLTSQFSPIWARYRHRHDGIKRDAHLRYNVLIAPALAHSYLKTFRKEKEPEEKK